MSHESFLTGLLLTLDVGRLFRLLAAFSVVEETAEDTFKPTPFSLAIGNEKTRVENVIRVG